MAIGFLGVIILGGLLLKLPFATKADLSWTDAYFTAVSASTVTGLTVVNTVETFTLTGQLIILLLIQFGGIGFMTIAILIILSLGKRIGLKQRLYIKEALNQTSIGGLIRLVKRLFIFSIVIEGCGVLLLLVLWLPKMGFLKAFYYGVFYSISGFNNAGFSLWPGSLSKFVEDPVINLVIPALYIIGGLGFSVLADLWYSKSFKQLSLHTKLTLSGAGVLILMGFLSVYLFEYSNPATLGNLGGMNKVFAAFFQGTVPRSSGFSTVDISQMNDATILITIFLMYIGAGSVSTGGGIKVTTFFVILLTVLTFLMNKSSIKVFGRQIRQEVIHKALAIVIISQAFLFTGCVMLMLTEKSQFLPVLFEVVSAFCTVGLSMGLTPDLSFIGKILIMLMMYVGLLGPLTVFFTLSQPRKEKIKYPNEDVMTG